jgi:predicted PurR-regulated permease PerM
MSDTPAPPTPATSPTTGDRPAPRWVRRLVVGVFVGLVLLYYGRGVLASLRPLLLMLVLSLFLSFAIEPAVNRMERSGVRRGAGTGIVFLVILVAMTGFGFAMATVLAEQVQSFADDVPRYLRDIGDWLERNFGVEGATDDLIAEYESGNLAERFTAFADDLARFGATVVNLLFQTFTIALFTFYLVAEGPVLRRQICSLLPANRQREVLELWDLAIEKTGGYIASRAILAIISTFAHWLAFGIIDLPSPLALALWVGVMSQFIPVIGTYLAGALPFAIGLLDDPGTGLWVLAFVVVYQQIENYLLAPRITAQTMEIHVALAFGAVIAGAAVLGPVGALLSLPAAATIQAFVSTYVRRHEVAEDVLAASRTRRGLEGVPVRTRRRSDGAPAGPSD